MIAKLNELRAAINSKEMEMIRVREELKKKLASLQSEKKSLEKEISLAEKLASVAVSSGFIKVKCSHFTFPFHHMGGGKPKDRTYSSSKIRYCEPEEALNLLLQGEEVKSGYGVEYTKV